MASDDPPQWSPWRFALAIVLGPLIALAIGLLGTGLYLLLEL